MLHSGCFYTFRRILPLGVILAASPVALHWPSSGTRTKELNYFLPIQQDFSTHFTFPAPAILPADCRPASWCCLSRSLGGCLMDHKVFPGQRLRTVAWRNVNEQNKPLSGSLAWCDALTHQATCHKQHFIFCSAWQSQFQLFNFFSFVTGSTGGLTAH